MSKGGILADIRVILRHLKSLPSEGNNSFKAHAMSEIRANMTNSNKEEVRAMRWKAHDAAQLVKALRVRKDLLDLHAGEKMTQDERIKLTAYRVGLNTPELYEAAAGDEEGGKGEGNTGGTSDATTDQARERTGT